MNRKPDIQDLDMPKDDIDCWNHYPKHRWVYELSRLLDSQNIKWRPYEASGLTDKELNIKLFSLKEYVHQPGLIFTKKSEGLHLHTEVYIVKGDIKLMRHIDLNSHEEKSTLNGEVELRLNAFVTLYFQKFTGVVGFETYSNEIFRCQLRPYLSIMDNTNFEVIKLIKRIYKKVLSV